MEFTLLFYSNFVSLLVILVILTIIKMHYVGVAA